MLISHTGNGGDWAMRQSAAHTGTGKTNRAAFFDREITIHPEQIDAYLDSLRQKGCSAETVRTYRRSLLAFYQALPEDKRLAADTLAQWSAALLKQGYKPRTVNVHVSSVNGLLNFLGLRGYQLAHPFVPPKEDAAPELSRAEYLRLLSAARELGKEQTYLIIKVLACTGLPLEDIPRLTTAAAAAGHMVTTANGARRIVRFPVCLREELLHYIQRTGTPTGPVFITRTGKPVNRTVVTGSIQRLARDARVAPEKCTPRCLRKLYQATRAGLEANLALLIEQAHERLLDTEQLTIGWEESGDWHG